MELIWVFLKQVGAVNAWSTGEWGAVNDQGVELTGLSINIKCWWH